MQKLNRKLLFTVIALVFFGVFIFLSASLAYLKKPEIFFKLVSIQIIAIILGFFGIYFIQNNRKINYLNIKNNSLYIFLFGFILQLLILIPGLGMTINGSTRWLNLGLMSIQPSEFFRIGLVLFLANILFLLKNELKDFKFLLKIFLLPVTFITIFYYYIHDLGSLMILLATVFMMLLFTQVNKKILISTAFISASLLLAIAWFFSAHAHERLESFIHPEKADIAGSFYQNYNMLVTIGSGRMFGSGYGESLQKFNNNIPEMISDSVFSIFAEEWGFIGSVILISLFLFLAYEIFLKVKKIKNDYQKYVVVGLATNILFPAFYNIAAAAAIVPLSGIPLTFISKGGTSIFFSLISIGIILLFTKS